MAQREVTEQELFTAKMLAVEHLFDPDRIWWWHRRTLPDGRALFLIPMIQGNRLGVSRDAEVCWFEDVYDYPDLGSSWKAVLGWDGEGDPEGWVRHCRDGEIPRRRPDGTPESEFRAP